MRPEERPKNGESPAVAGRSWGTGATGLEPATSGVTGRRSNQLSYAPRGVATPSMARVTGPDLPAGTGPRVGPQLGGPPWVSGASTDQPGGGALCPIIASACGQRR
jgi:hypothetical protein